jgi:hypothetical protein
MVEAIVFNGINSLDFQDVRSNVTRIPEVIARIRHAQNIWDEKQTAHFDLLNFICAEDKGFFNNIHLKSLASAVVHVGLYDRYLRFYKTPDFFVGNFNGDSALKVACGLMTFEELVEASAKALNPDTTLRWTLVKENSAEPVLAGISLTEYAAFRKRSDGTFERLELPRVDVRKIVHSLIEENGLKKVINIGPGNTMISRTTDDLILEDVQILESIDLDPMLNWFWTGLRDAIPA